MDKSSLIDYLDYVISHSINQIEFVKNNEISETDIKKIGEYYSDISLLIENIYIHLRDNGYKVDMDNSAKSYKELYSKYKRDSIISRIISD